MEVNNAVQPTAEQVQTFVGGGEGPIVMVNLLKFREKAEYPDGRDSELSGAEAYLRYATEMKKLVEAGGGRFIFGGKVRTLLLGSVESLWDQVGLVEYPSPAGLLKIATSPEYREIEVHRLAGLEGQLNIETTGASLF